MTPAGTTHAEGRCRNAILGRTGARCEGCASGPWTDKAHRVARSAGGLWSPGNVLGLCPLCHGWAHAHPVDAGVCGWIVPPWRDPQSVPVFLSSATLTPGWYSLSEDGSPHPDTRGPGPDGMPPPETLPPHYPRRLLLPPALIPVPRRPPRHRQP